MKIRTGFVSNSSSSSFVCEVCGAVESGYDACLSDLGFVECENGHTFCESHILHPKEYGELEEGDEKYPDYEGSGYNVPAYFCPICNLKDLSDSDVMAYLLMTNKKNKAIIIEEINTEYGDYETFSKAMKGK